MKIQTQLETLPSLGETVVLFIIRSNEFVSGYQIRKLFMETTKRGLSFGTLVPMLHRFEKSEFVVRQRDENNPPSYLWRLTALGAQELESRLLLLSKVLQHNTAGFQNVRTPSKISAQPEMQAASTERLDFEW